MHFPIIELKRNKDDRYILSFDDRTLNHFTDYYGEEYTKQERINTINAQWFRDLFRGLAEVDPEEGVIRVFDKETIKKTLDDYFKHLLEKLSELKNDTIIWRRFHSLRMAGYEYDDYSTLFYVDGVGYTSMQFVEDLVYYAGETLYIGKIYDAHC